MPEGDAWRQQVPARRQARHARGKRDGVRGGTQSLAATDLLPYAHALGFDTAILCAVLDEMERTRRDV